MHRRTFLEAGLATVGGSLAAGLTAGQAENSFQPVGSVDVPGAAEAVPHPEGNVVYVAAGDGVAAVDITGGNPQVVAEDRGIEIDAGGEIRGIWDLWPWEDRLIAAGPANHGVSAASGFALYDTADPANPERLTVYETDFHIHNASFDDGIVYLTGSGLPRQPLVMVDVSDDDPTEVGRFSIIDYDEGWGDVAGGLRSLHDVHVHESIAYLAHWDAGSWLVDVSDPTSPAVLSRVGPYTLAEAQELGTSEAFVPPGNSHVTTVDDDATIMAVGAEAWANDAGEGGPGGVTLYDISDKTDPQELATIEAPESYGQTRSEWFTTAHNFDISNSRLYTSWYFGGVKIHDIDDPANPEEIAWWRQPGEASFWTAQSAGDVVVASSVNIQSKIGSAHATRDALYVFPNAPGTQPNPPSLTDPSGDNGGTGDGDGGTDDGNGDDGGADSEGDGQSDDSGAGFGVAAAVLGAAGAGYALARKGRQE